MRCAHVIQRVGTFHEGNEMTRRLLAAGAVALLVALVTGPAAATDDYTRPFYQRTQTMDYGMDRNPATCQQLAWNNSVFNDCNAHHLYSYDNHTGLDYDMAPGTAVAAARLGKVTFVYEGTANGNHTLPENKVHIEHQVQTDGKGLARTVYAHLAYMSVIPTTAAGSNLVSAGEKIALSDCTGACTGPHVHYELATRTTTAGAWVTRDPQYEQRWTTPGAYGRAPFLGTYISESTESTTVYVGATWTHWVKFRNDGGRTWYWTNPYNSAGRILLSGYDPGTQTFRSSAFYVSGDWENTTNVTKADSSLVPPDVTTQFTFQLHAPYAPGTKYYPERFDIRVAGLFWLNYYENPGISGFFIPINVICC